MKAGLLTTILFLLVYVSYGQEDYVPSESELNRFFNTKTYIVLDPNPISHYNAKLKKAAKNNWEITDYEFLDYSKFDKMRKKPEYSFLVENIVVFDKDKTKARYRFLSLLMGKKTQLIKKMPTIVAVPLSYKQVDEEYYSYKLGVIVRFIQKHARLMKENPDIISDDIFDYYNKNMKDIKDKTLYFIEDELAEEVNTEEKIKEHYPHEVKIVSRDEVEKAIEEKREDVVFLHKVGPQGTRHHARCYKILMGAKDAEFYYFDYHNVKKGKRPDGFLKRDFRKLKRKASDGWF
ncbi:MAG: hypothetical protein ACQESJ_00455 [Bacteroidota bacterium]